jgi:putative NIF3 family GTP cyclohydrolase 1 type 2
MRARNISQILESIAPLASGVAGDRQGFLFGDPEMEITGVACMWCAHSSSIRAAAKLGLNLLIVHEALFEEPQQTPWYSGAKTPDEIAANRNRQELLTAHNMAVYRIHSSWDALSHDGVPDRAVAALELPGLQIVAAQKYFKVVQNAAALRVRELAERARQKLNLPWVRVFGDAERSIRRFAFLIGGFGENQLHMPQAAVELGAEAILIGEMSEFVVINALECGVPVIETLHSSSEIPALMRQAELLRTRLPEIPVAYVPSGALHF